MKLWKIQINIWVGAGEAQHNLSLWEHICEVALEVRVILIHVSLCQDFLGFSSLFNFL